jgi:hypothetical protein
LFLMMTALAWMTCLKPPSCRNAGLYEVCCLQPTNRTLYKLVDWKQLSMLVGRGGSASVQDALYMQWHTQMLNTTIRTMEAASENSVGNGMNDDDIVDNEAEEVEEHPDSDNTDSADDGDW